MTYTTNIRLDDDLAEAVKAYAKASGGISIADAIRILIAKGLEREGGAAGFRDVTIPARRKAAERSLNEVAAGLLPEGCRLEWAQERDALYRIADEDEKP